MASELSSSYPAIKPVNILQDQCTSLPGWGHKSTPNCNTVRSADYCPNCHKVEPHHHHCFNWECPVCYPWAAGRAASRAADHIYGSYEAHRKAGIHPGFLNHIELSVPEEQYNNFNEKEYREKAIEYSKQIGISGGSIVFHKYRIEKEYQILIRKNNLLVKKQLYKDLGKKKGKEAWKELRKGKGYWKDVQENILGLNSREEYLKFGPHYHIVGFFKLKQKSSEFEKETKWTYKNISMSKGRGEENKDSINRILTYQLTHHYVKKNRLSYSYFGSAHSSVILKKTHWEKHEKQCSCSSPMYKVPVQNEQQELAIREGTFRPVIDRFSRVSQEKTITHYYYLRNEKTKHDLQSQKEIESERVRSWLRDRDKEGGGVLCPPPAPDV